MHISWKRVFWSIKETHKWLWVRKSYRWCHQIVSDTRQPSWENSYLIYGKSRWVFQSNMHTSRGKTGSISCAAQETIWVPVKNHKHMKVMIDKNFEFSSPGLWVMYNADFTGPFASNCYFQLLNFNCKKGWFPCPFLKNVREDLAFMGVNGHIHAVVAKCLLPTLLFISCPCVSFLTSLHCFC